MIAGFAERVPSPRLVAGQGAIPRHVPDGILRLPELFAQQRQVVAAAKDHGHALRPRRGLGRVGDAVGVLVIGDRERDSQLPHRLAEAARGNSEDPVSARNNGYLSRLIKKNPNKPDALYERAVDMQVGDVSDIPIMYAGNWYILRRGHAGKRR